MNKTISVIVPAFNEEMRIANTLKTLQRVKPALNIIVIDDGSTDTTVEKVAKFNNISLIKNKKNMGKGYALKIGTESIIDESDIIVYLDADIQESANEVYRLINPIVENEADVTVAKFPASTKKGGFGLVKTLARYGVYYKTGVKLSCALSGQRGFKKEVLQNINLDYQGFEVELGMIIDIINNNYKVREVDVNMYHNITGRDLKGFLHRGKQFYHIFKLLFY